MIAIKVISGALLLFLLTACEPGTGASHSQADYERHKSNRDSYMFQGL